MTKHGGRFLCAQKFLGFSVVSGTAVFKVYAPDGAIVDLEIVHAGLRPIPDSELVVSGVLDHQVAAVLVYALDGIGIV